MYGGIGSGYRENDTFKNSSPTSDSIKCLQKHVMLFSTLPRLYQGHNSKHSPSSDNIIENLFTFSYDTMSTAFRCKKFGIEI